MTPNVRYTTRWNKTTHRPTAGHSWVDPDTARQHLESGDGIEIVESSAVDEDDVPKPKWVMGWGGLGVRVQFLDAHGSVWRLIDYKLIDGRLWRWITTDYTYPDQNQRWRLNRSTGSVKTAVNPDGRGDVTIADHVQNRESFGEFSGRADESYWVDTPEFGDWDALADPGPSALEVSGRSSAVGA